MILHHFLLKLLFIFYVFSFHYTKHGNRLTCDIGITCNLGFMCGSSVLDKDGVSACMIATEMCIWLYSQRLSLLEQLQSIYKQYVKIVLIASLVTVITFLITLEYTHEDCCWL